MKKALFLDLDGTLLNDQKEITAGNKQAINAALANGNKVIISTGRPLVSVKILAKELGLTSEGCFAISFNGGEIYDLYNEKSIYKKTIPLEYVQYIFDKASEWGLHCQTYNETHVIATKETKALKHYIERTNVPPLVVPDLSTALTADPVKLIVIDLNDHDKLVRFRAETAAWAEGKIDRIFSNEEYLEHIAPDVSKGNAVRYLCEYLDIPISNTIAAGDAENDLSMIAAAHIGIAMVNATPTVKAAANHTTTNDNNHDAIAEIIETFL